jgi:predicted MPP superfamily phosphohydrolase
LAPALADLDARYGVFTIIGNHDLWTDVRVVQQGLDDSRLPILRNRGVTLQAGRAKIHLAGVDDVWNGKPDLATTLDETPADALTILLSHEPDYADTVARDGRVALQLSGHSHGGQVRLPGIGAPILPYLGKKYDQGLYRVGQMWVYTNRGIGVVGPPVRINCPPEITKITLTRT